MAKASTPAKSAESAPKRKMLTPAERIAKAEADLAALKAKAAEKGTKRVAVIDAKLKVATDKRAKLNAEITALETEKAALSPAESVAADDSDS